MIEFRQKVFSEYDAMKSLYNELMRKDSPWRYKIRVIDTSSLLPVLRGNNVVIERFVISTQAFKHDKYRMYLKVGAKAKMPEGVRLPGRNTSKKLWDTSIKLSGSAKFFQKNNSETEFREKLFDNNKKNNNNNNGGGGDINSGIDFGRVSIEREMTIPRGETLEYDKKERSIVLEFESIPDAVAALNILPFGLNYNMYLLDV